MSLSGTDNVNKMTYIIRFLPGVICRDARARESTILGCSTAGRRLEPRNGDKRSLFDKRDEGSRRRRALGV